MRSLAAPALLAAALALAPVVTGYAPAFAQDFSITNPDAPVNNGHPDVMRQLQAWWDAHAFYPRHASQNDEGGTVQIHLQVYSDGRIWKVDVVKGSGSPSLDAAAVAVFHGGFVQPFPERSPDADLELSLHYVLAHRHDQPVPAGYTAAPVKRPFAIMNDPVKSPILETMLQKTCTGTVVKEGIRNHPAYGARHSVQAVFFRKPDGTPWVQFYDGDEMLLAPVNEVGKMVQWTGKEEHPRKNVTFQYQYTVWTDGENKLTGNIEAYFDHSTLGPQGINTSGTADFTCATELVPPIAWTSLRVKTIQAPSGDPP